MESGLQRVPIQLPSGVIWAEAETIGEITGRVDVARISDARPFSIDVIRTAIEGLSHVVQEALASAKPDRATVEFGLEVGVESGKLTALWVKGTGTANLKISLTWGHND
jgi:hypothetical protein